MAIPTETTLEKTPAPAPNGKHPAPPECLAAPTERALSTAQAATLKRLHAMLLQAQRDVQSFAVYLHDEHVAPVSEGWRLNLSEARLTKVEPKDGEEPSA